MIVVTSGGGRTGRHILAALQGRGVPVRAFVHRERPDLLELGATELFVGDMLDREALCSAFSGADAVVHTGPIDINEPVMGRWAVDAAKAAGVGHFVYVSVTHPQTEWLINHRNKLVVEDHLIDSGVPFTILQPMHYFQNIDVLGAVERGVYASPYGRSSRLSFVDLLDLGEAVAKVAAQPGHHYATYEICGADYLNTDEVVAAISDAAGKPIENVEFSLDEFLQRIPGTEGYLGDMLTRLMTYYRRHGIRGNPNVLTWLLGRPPTTIRDYIARMLAA